MNSADLIHWIIRAVVACLLIVTALVVVRKFREGARK